MGSSLLLRDGIASPRSSAIPGTSDWQVLGRFWGSGRLLRGLHARLMVQTK